MWNDDGTSRFFYPSILMDLQHLDRISPHQPIASPMLDSFIIPSTVLPGSEADLYGQDNHQCLADSPHGDTENNLIPNQLHVPFHDQGASTNHSFQSPEAYRTALSGTEPLTTLPMFTLPSFDTPPEPLSHKNDQYPYLTSHMVTANPAQNTGVVGRSDFQGSTNSHIHPCGYLSQHGHEIHHAKPLASMASWNNNAICDTGEACLSLHLENFDLPSTPWYGDLPDLNAEILDLGGLEMQQYPTQQINITAEVEKSTSAARPESHHVGGNKVTDENIHHGTCSPQNTSGLLNSNLVPVIAAERRPEDSRTTHESGSHGSSRNNHFMTLEDATTNATDNSSFQLGAQQTSSKATLPPPSRRVLAVRRTKLKPGGGVEMTFALHGERIRKRRPLTADQKASRARTRQMSACLPCKLDRKGVSRLVSSYTLRYDRANPLP